MPLFRKIFSGGSSHGLPPQVGASWDSLESTPTTGTLPNPFPTSSLLPATTTEPPTKTTVTAEAPTSPTFLPSGPISPPESPPPTKTPHALEPVTEAQTSGSSQNLGQHATRTLANVSPRPPTAAGFNLWHPPKPRVGSTKSESSAFSGSPVSSRSNTASTAATSTSSTATSIRKLTTRATAGLDLRKEARQNRHPKKATCEQTFSTYCLEWEALREWLHRRFEGYDFDENELRVPNVEHDSYKFNTPEPLTAKDKADIHKLRWDYDSSKE
ncbi:hypothetical protein B0T24DRAFT_391875 [Lasiosphaeria ovina]|uniref:Uncharacterized protein n=1 Tax=Lasiosphaeria ovina TaxID=92902 RepID=A0AAE0JWW4_9PEZI|nr:hypothetical protein B0T24DRAFT_391875 [Lasiosphaeria ovina]